MSRVGSIDEALRSARPDRLVETLDAFLCDLHGAKTTTVWLADYRTTSLSPVHAADIDDLEARLAAATRAYASQSPVTEVRADVVRLHLPVTSWGERIGVLSIDLDRSRAEYGPVTSRLQPLADAFAGALQAAYKRTDRYHVARRRSRLTMAAEMQWDLLPARGYEQPGVRLAGQLEPAYAVCGDHFDWSANGDWLTVTALNGMGTGLEAAMLSTLAVNAMRNARRSARTSEAGHGGLVDQAVLAADAVYSQYGGSRYVETLLMALNIRTGELRLIDAGSPRLILARGGQVQDLPLDQQLPLGMFGDTRYTEEVIRLEPGDRLYIASDGVHEAAKTNEASFGERELVRAIRSSRLQPPAEAIGTIMRRLRDYHGGTESTDDALVVCIDWTPTADH